MFTVVHEQFMTDTCDFADIVLPATTQLEHFDLHKAYGHFYLTVNEPAIEPLHESKANTEVFRLLAARLGFGEDCFRDSDEEIARQALDVRHPALEGVTLELLRERGWLRMNLPDDYAPFAEGGFKTARRRVVIGSCGAGLPSCRLHPPSESRASRRGWPSATLPLLTPRRTPSSIRASPSAEAVAAGGRALRRDHPRGLPRAASPKATACAPSTGAARASSAP